MSIFLIVLAAGDSKRLNLSVPKPFQAVNNKTLLDYTINSFGSFPEIKKKIIVYNKKHQKYLKKIKLTNFIKVQGGKSRQESTFKALKRIKNMNCNKVLIHDAARPNPSKKIIRSIINKLNKNHAVIPVIKSTDAVKRIKKNIIFKNIERSTLRFSQTPQGFTYNKIYKKHIKYKKTFFDDDSALFVNDKEKILTINGSKNNLKITNLEDLEIFKKLKNGLIYHGIGFDVHKLVPKRKLYLGGLNIKSKLGTLGHSDGDPVLHAIIDAILGAIKMGDIGESFPDKKKKFKNIRSTFLLKEIMNQVQSKGYLINNLDINIITQTPKIQKYKKKIISNISRLCKISKKKINLKGKTTEKLGVIGKKKAIACEAIISIIKYD